MVAAKMTIPATLDALRVPVDGLVPYGANPRRGNVDVIVESLGRHGQYRPIVVRAGTSEVLAGNHTLAAARQLGWAEIAATFVEVSDDDAARIVLVDNRSNDLATYDDAGLVALLASLPDLEGTGFSQSDLDALLASVVEPPSLTDPDDVPELPAEPTSVLGDVWVLGPHRVVCGDATDVTAYDALLEGALADMVWTDPPYGVAYTAKNAMLNAQDGGSRLETGIDSDELDGAALAVFLGDSLGAALVASKPGASWWVAAPCLAQPLRAFADVLADLGVWRRTLVWVKDGFVLGRADYHGRHEQLLYGWAPGAPHTPPPDRSQDSVWEFPRPRKNDLHPTMKPVALIARAVGNHTKPGGLVLDPFGGSGSTLIACHDTNRVARLIELDPRYVDVICRRYQEHTGDKPVLESTGEPHDFTRATR